MIPEATKSVLSNLIEAKILPKTMSTKKVVRYLNSKEFHRAKLYEPEFKKILGRRRKGIRYEFDTLKVIEFELKSQGTIDFS
ncbi:MAG: hypothetical protein COB12_02775 [Flavobacterium sp.]|nr:MAG: hypothetical protein COB12_02775 [Flavobacterium sp.]